MAVEKAVKRQRLKSILGKHLKSLNKSACLLKVLMNDTKQSSLRCEQVNMLN